jgi:hypothetical protein
LPGLTGAIIEWRPKPMQRPDITDAILMTVRSLLAVVAVVASAAAGQAVAGAQTTKASLTLASTRPLAIRGRGFSPHERVRLTVVTHSRRVRRIRTGSAGTFTVTFSDLSYDRCRDGLIIHATGTRHAATLKLPQPECPVP